MKTFVMYGPDTREHVDFVRGLALDLLERRVDCEVDLLAKTPSEGWRAWTERRATEADVVLLVMSPNFGERIEATATPGSRRAPRHDAKLASRLIAQARGSSARVLVALPDDAPESIVPSTASPLPRFRYPSQARELAAQLAPPRSTTIPSSQSRRAPSSSPGRSQRRASSGHSARSSVVSRESPATLDLLRTYLETLIHVYERNAASSHFVRPAGESASGRVADLIEHLRTVVSGNPQAMVLILGEYGSGKTSVARRFAYELGRDALAGAPDPIIPFYFSLSFLKKATNLVRALSRYIGRYDLRLSEATLLALFQGTGRAVLVLDGLDELGERTQRAETPEFLAALTELRAIPGLRVVLTCRSTFFRDMVDEEQTHATAKLSLTPFDDRQIAEYMAYASQEAQRGLASVFERVPRLRDLCRTPIHLFLSQEYVAERADIGEGFRLIDLYDAFVKKNLVVHAGTNPGWSPAARREFVRRLLYVMFDEEVFEMTMGDLERVLRQELPDASADELGKMAGQIVNASFFTRAGHAFRPLHLSFLEYFVAETLVIDLYAGRIDKWNRRPLYAEVFDFMIQMIQRRGVDGLPVRAIAASDQEEAPSNFLATMYRWPVPAVRSFFEELLLDGRFPLVRCVACQGVGMYDSPDILPTLLKSFEREPNGIIRAVVQRLLERLTDKVDIEARADIHLRLAAPVKLSAEDAERILSTSKNKFALIAYRKALLLGDQRPSSTIAAIYLLAAIGDAESLAPIAAVAAKTAIQAIRTAYTHAQKLGNVSPSPDS
jgi:hypothetical protein